jgi:DNA-binding NtrC family response regulator
MTGSTSILVVDDERTLARAIRAYLEESGYTVEVAGDAEAALALLPRFHPDVVITDVRLPGLDGITLLRRIREFDPAISVVVMTAHGSIEGAVEAVKLGAFDYLKKPVDLEELKLIAERAHETNTLRQELSYYRRRGTGGQSFAEVIGESPALRVVLDQARAIAALDDTPPVLITGETGTGKGLVARAIHASGPRAAKPFIDVNCTALPATLMESELFGHERGAFTDAKESRLGLFEAAEGGFIFLDEIGDVEISLQGKLLKAIEERVVRRVGGVRDRKIDVRILAATNRDLEREASQDRFRRDLYFRLAVLLLRLPPLRDRGNDVLLLADQYLRRFGAKYGRRVHRITPEAQALLRSYPWPGNVRELSHVMERAVLWSRTDEIGPDHLSLTRPVDSPLAVPAEGMAVQEPTAELQVPGQQPLPPRGTSLEQWERTLLEQALRESAGNQTRAAERLGISRDTLRYRLKKYGITG